MSKSEKNYTDPMELVEKYGADALRLALANSPVMQGENILFSDSTVEESYKKNIMRLENVLDFYNISLCDLNKDILKDYFYLKDKTKNIADIWIQARLIELEKSITKGFENYKLDLATQAIPEFIDDLSTWYLKSSRERIKDKENISSFLDGMTTLKYVLIEFSKLIAPMMPFLAERIYQDMKQNDIDKKESVHLESWPKYNIITDDFIIVQVADMKRIRDLISEGLMLRQKINIPVRQPLQSFTAKVSIIGNLQDYEYLIKDQLNVKRFILSDLENVREFDVNINTELKREGDQRELSRVIKDMRRDLGLVASDSIALVIDSIRADLIDDEYKKEMKIIKVEIGEKLNVYKCD